MPSLGCVGGTAWGREVWAWSQKKNLSRGLHSLHFLEECRREQETADMSVLFFFFLSLISLLTIFIKCYPTTLKFSETHV